MATTQPRTRIHVWLSWETTGKEGELPPSFELIRHTEHQRRTRGNWYRDSDVRDGPAGHKREIVHVLTRAELAKHIAEGAEALSWPAN